jgi:predicted  nucleic acid-binding Zn-ribbon protein
LLTLEPGLYRVQAEMTGENAQATSQSADLQKHMERMLALLESAQKTYTSDHPKILEMRTQIANLQTLLANASAQGNRAATAALEFRVP